MQSKFLAQNLEISSLEFVKIGDSLRFATPSLERLTNLLFLIIDKNEEKTVLFIYAL